MGTVRDVPYTHHTIIATVRSDANTNMGRARKYFSYQIAYLVFDVI